MSGAEEVQLSFLGRGLPLAFRRRTTVWPARSWRAYHAVEWRDALVVVERGELELRCDRGGTYRLQQGTVGHLADVPLVLVGNPGLEIAVVVAISRARPDQPL